MILKKNPKHSETCPSCPQSFFKPSCLPQHGWPQISDKQRKNNKHRSGPFCPNLSPLELPGSSNNTRRKSETNAKHSLLSPYTVSYSSEMLQLKNSLRGKKSAWKEQVVINSLLTGLLIELVDSREISGNLAVGWCAFEKTTFLWAVASRTFCSRIFLLWSTCFWRFSFRHNSLCCSVSVPHETLPCVPELSLTLWKCFCKMGNEKMCFRLRGMSWDDVFCVSFGANI